MSTWLLNILTTLVNRAHADTLADALEAALTHGDTESPDDEEAYAIVARRLEELRHREAELLAEESRAPLNPDYNELPF